jgi:hypothetical protein
MLIYFKCCYMILLSLHLSSCRLAELGDGSTKTSKIRTLFFSVTIIFFVLILLLPCLLILLLVRQQLELGR